MSDRPPMQPSGTDNGSNELLKVTNLKVHFPVTRGFVFRRQIGSLRAVDGIDLEIGRGETLGLVGESGCGKTTTGRALLRLVKLTSGEILMDGRDVAQLRGEALRQTRRRMQMIFQDPYSSLDPRMTAGSIIAEPLSTFRLARGSQLKQMVQELMDECGLNPAHVNRYPHEFSGGQRQRIGIARALALKPDFIVADEPISALDVSIQAQILNLLKTLQERYELSYLFITHDLAAVRLVAHRVAVMYVGKLVEEASSTKITEHPLHPYTRALISAVPIPDPAKERARQRVVLPGDVPSLMNPPSGCCFRPRCLYSEPLCALEEPTLRTVSPGHRVACHMVADEDKETGADATLVPYASSAYQSISSDSNH